MCVLANDKQLHDLKRFCCDPRIDPTFNLCQFSVNVTTYRHLQLGLQEQFQCFLAPCMLVHQLKTMKSYNFLASFIVELKAFGTDGEKALENALALQLKKT